MVPFCVFVCLVVCLQHTSLPSTHTHTHTHTHTTHTQGKGTEDISHYARARLTHLDIPNIHAVRESYEALRSVCLSTVSGKWHSALESTQWLNYVSVILKVRTVGVWGVWVEEALGLVCWLGLGLIRVSR